MGLDFEKSKRRTRSQEAHCALVAALAFGVKPGAPSRLSKSEEREALANALSRFNGKVRQLPTIHRLECLCGHRASVAVRADRVNPRFRCSKCGARL